MDFTVYMREFFAMLERRNYACMPEQWRKVPEGLNHPVCLNYKDWPLFDVPEQSESDSNAAPKRSFDDWMEFISCGRNKA